MQSIIDKVKFEVPVAVIGDVLGAMAQIDRITDGMYPYQISTMIATLALLKNPNPDMENILINFGSNCRIFTDGSSTESRVNKFMTGHTIQVPKLIDRTKDFLWNYQNVMQFLRPVNEGTYLYTVAQRFAAWIEEILI